MYWTKVRIFFIHVSNQSNLFFYYFFCSLNRFFETEGIAALTMLVSQYKIAIKDDPQFAGETFEERKSRILSTRKGITLTYVFLIFNFSFLD